MGTAVAPLCIPLVSTSIPQRENIPPPVRQHRGVYDPVGHALLVPQCVSDGVGRTRVRGAEGHLRRCRQPTPAPSSSAGTEGNVRRRKIHSRPPKLPPRPWSQFAAGMTELGVETDKATLVLSLTLRLPFFKERRTCSLMQS